ncbi:molybdenum ABC transporter permease [Pedobacter sp. ASV28]|uniref:molybdenum ABC transporter permease n=1 Tax=Pedobacter sp. ASV28 TaxID=2795123 RepID=UPI001E5EC9E7|nr:molybdenum ABC transporter permease [Pedobacter sp. ASV28]
MVSSLVIGIIFLVAGLGLRYWINRRRFYRRGPMGGQGFSSYEKSVAVTLLERVGKWIAYGLIIFGLLSLWVYSREKEAKEKTVQSVGTGKQK